MAKLLSIGLPNADTKKSKSNIATIPVEGDIVTRFNEARDQIDKAEEVIEKLHPLLVETGLLHVFEHNVDHATEPKGLVSSVNLSDEETGEIVQFTWTKKATKTDPDLVNEEFKALRTVDGKKANVNDYAGFEVVAAFDSSVFMVDGKFNKDRYEAYMEAIALVSAQLKVPVPLTCTQVLKPKAEFHTRRWLDFDVEANLLLQTVLPTQTSLKPIRPEKE